MVTNDPVAVCFGTLKFCVSKNAVCLLGWLS
jgi:hypothetical protein